LGEFGARNLTPIGGPVNEIDKLRNIHGLLDSRTMRRRFTQRF
jgi:hypothetical protein